MDLREYKRHVEQLSFSKKLPAAVYVYRDAGVSLGEGLDQLVGQVVVAFQVGAEFNVLKFHTDELKVSFLSYPDFFEEAHPVLRKAVTIDLRSGKARHNDYAENLNPPILHRKESFLPAESFFCCRSVFPGLHRGRSLRGGPYRRDSKGSGECARALRFDQRFDRY